MREKCPVYVVLEPAYRVAQHFQRLCQAGGDMHVQMQVIGHYNIFKNRYAGVESRHGRQRLGHYAAYR